MQRRLAIENEILLLEKALSIVIDELIDIARSSLCEKIVENSKTTKRLSMYRMM